MNVLIVGKGDGSWQMRGVQLGAAIGARVTSQPMDTDWKWADVIVLIKRAYLQWAARATATGAPVVWYALDFWKQPQQNNLDDTASRRLLDDALRVIKPALVIGATEAQAKAAGGVCLPHHHRIGLTAKPPAEKVSLVAYEGSERYLGVWRQAIEQACQARGWRFVINPPDLSAADLIVAFRDGQWDGWMCRQWKSGVKLANAVTAGRPVLTNPCAACDELDVIGSVLEHPKALSDALDAWTPYEHRRQAWQQCALLASELSLQLIASRYRLMLERVMRGNVVAEIHEHHDRTVFDAMQVA